MSIFKRLIKSLQKILSTKPKSRRKINKRQSASKKKSKYNKNKVHLSKKNKFKKTSVKPSKAKPKPVAANNSKKKPKKIAVAKPAYKVKLIGEITHHFSKISVVVIKLTDGLVKGDKIQIKGASREFIQVVKSMQIESVDVSVAKKGQLIGLKVANQPKVGDKVYKILS